ncbi:serine hydrolase domain-containing protein [Kitasatospora purpeofusca]|uniref:serine hydrolase domain-containing protein n=1 Tax=Kitasatospora purpeofusca TaxID=67352 RepID=UPI0036D226C8
MRTTTGRTGRAGRAGRAGRTARLVAAGVLGAVLVGTSAPVAMAAGAAGASGGGAVAVAAPGAATGANPVSPAFAAIQGELGAVVDAGEATWDLARVVDRGRTLWQGTAGVAELDDRSAVDPDGRFRIGSLTKMFTATVVLQLVGEGRVRLDDPVSAYLPGVVPGGERITVRQLLDHTSGLFSYTDDQRFVPRTAEGVEAWAATGRWRTWTAEEIVADAVAHPPYFAPGASWHYSNTNYLLAGMIIQKSTGRTWNQEVERRIIRPLGLRQTSMPVSSPLITGPHAHLYTQLPGGPVDTTLINPSAGGAAGAGISSTADLARFHAALFGGRLLRPAELAAMKATVDTGVPGYRYGLGVGSVDLGCGVVWGHSGSIHRNIAYVLGTEDGRRQAVVAAGQYGYRDPDDVFAGLEKAASCAVAGSGAGTGS